VPPDYQLVEKTVQGNAFTHLRIAVRKQKYNTLHRCGTTVLRRY
jgi:hypothetical protein